MIIVAACVEGLFCPVAGSTLNNLGALLNYNNLATPLTLSRKVSLNIRKRWVTYTARSKK